jgi:hypothetical protein
MIPQRVHTMRGPNAGTGTSSAAAVPMDPFGPLLDHLIGGGQQCFGDGKAERLGGLEVDHIVVNGLTEQAPDVL